MTLVRAVAMVCLLDAVIGLLLLATMTSGLRSGVGALLGLVGGMVIPVLAGREVLAVGARAPLGAVLRWLC